tara:strand:- start:222 stop:491 length:270 start_codon:yes stop_codon:yes gene_type:complete
MAKTITLSATKVQSIVVNQSFGPEELENGISCTVSYTVVDDAGDSAMHKSSTKYTTDSTFSPQLSGDSAKLLTDFWNSIESAMLEREEL